ncbi:MAG: hypothetical protein R6X32_22715, partial [Chloroflexota bacterium]
MSSEFDFEPYDPYEPEQPGWSLRKRIIFGLIAVVAILSMLGSAVAGIVWLATQDQQQTWPTPTPTRWWGPIVEEQGSEVAKGQRGEVTYTSATLQPGPFAFQGFSVAAVSQPRRLLG